MFSRKYLACVVFALMFFSSVALAAEAKYAAGDSGPVVEQIQVALRDSGYYGGQVDGKFTALTRQAVLKFQKESGLKADGVVEEKTFKALTGNKLPEHTVEAPQMKATGIPAKILSTAISYQGVKYRFGGASPSGFDCSGFVMYVFDKHGVKLPRTADRQYEVGKSIRSKSDLKPGDLVFFETYEKGASHVGIYEGNGKFVHASSSRGVTVSALSEKYYASRYLGAKRVL